MSCPLRLSAREQVSESCQLCATRRALGRGSACQLPPRRSAVRLREREGSPHRWRPRPAQVGRHPRSVSLLLGTLSTRQWSAAPPQSNANSQVAAVHETVALVRTSLVGSWLVFMQLA